MLHYLVMVIRKRCALMLIEMFPQDDVWVEDGGTLVLQCTLSKNGHNCSSAFTSSDIVFKRGGQHGSTFGVEHVRVLSVDTAQLVLEKFRIGNETNYFTCSLPNLGWVRANDENYDHNIVQTYSKSELDSRANAFEKPLLHEFPSCREFVVLRNQSERSFW